MNISINLTPRQIDFLDASYRYAVVFFGGARGGGKSHGMRTICMVRALEQSGVRIGLFRRSHPELMSNHVRTLLAEHPWLARNYNKSEHLLTFPNGSTIEFCYCDSEDDVLRYQGREFHILGIDEAGQWPEGMWWTLYGSCRSSKVDIKPVALLTGNPGGIGHSWLKRLFVDRNYRKSERGEDYHFVKSLIYDCAPIMSADPGYLRRLEAEPNEVLRRAYLHGDWTVFAGQFFNEFDLDTHILPHDWEPRPYWPVYVSHDPGHWHPCVWLLWCADEQGGVYLIREIVERGLDIDRQAERVWQWPEMERVEVVISGRDAWTRLKDGGPCIAEQYATIKPRPIYFVEANTDRVQGAGQVRAFLAVRNGRPRMMIHPRCRRTIECIPRLVHNKDRPEDVLKIDATDSDPFSGDDCYDAVRYFLMSRPAASASDPEADVIPTTYEERIKKFMKKRRVRLAKQSKNRVGVDPVLGSKF